MHIVCGLEAQAWHNIVFLGTYYADVLKAVICESLAVDDAHLRDHRA